MAPGSQGFPSKSSLRLTFKTALPIGKGPKGIHRVPSMAETNARKNDSDVGADVDNQEHNVLKPIPSPSYYLHPSSLSWYSHLPKQDALQMPRGGFCTLHFPSRDFLLKGTKRRPVTWMIHSKLGRNNKAECLSMADLMENLIFAKSKGLHARSRLTSIFFRSRLFPNASFTTAGES